MSYKCRMEELSHTQYLKMSLINKKNNLDFVIKAALQQAFPVWVNGIFKIITLVWTNQPDNYEITTACSKRMFKTTVATQLNVNSPGLICLRSVSLWPSLALSFPLRIFLRPTLELRSFNSTQTASFFLSQSKTQKSNLYNQLSSFRCLK